MNNFIYRVMSADIPVIYIVVRVHMHVKCVIRHTVTVVVLKGINTYTVVSALLFVMCVIRYTVTRVF